MKEYRNCYFTILTAHEIGVDRPDWSEGVFIPFADADIVFIDRVRDNGHTKDLLYVEDRRTGERYYPEKEHKE